MPAIQIAALVVALLVSSGALAFFLRFGTRLAFAERDAAKALNKAEEHDKDIAATKERVTLMESTLKDISNSLSKLHVIDRIASAVDVLKERLDNNCKDTSEVKQELREFIKAQAQK